MLRSPNEIVTASKVSSANGSWVPSPAVNGSAGRACLPTCSIPSEKSHGHHLRAAVGERLARRAGAGGEVEHPLARTRVDRRDHGAAPLPVLAEREDVVGDVVAPGDRVEHPTYVGRLLVELCTDHAQRLRGAAPPYGTGSRASPGRATSRTSCASSHRSSAGPGRSWLDGHPVDRVSWHWLACEHRPSPAGCPGLERAVGQDADARRRSLSMVMPPAAAGASPGR